MTTKAVFYYHIASGEDWAKYHPTAFRETADDRMLDERKEILIHFRYPLDHPTYLAFKNENGFTRKAFAECVAKGYKDIYQEEDKTSTISSDPKGMGHRRVKTDGKYRIYSHDIADLILEGAELDGEGVWQLNIGS